MLPHHFEVVSTTNFSLSAVERFFKLGVALVEQVLNADAEIQTRRVSVTKSGVETNVGRNCCVSR